MFLSQELRPELLCQLEHRNFCAMTSSLPQVMHYAAGSYFGELAMLKEPWATPWASERGLFEVAESLDSCVTLVALALAVCNPF